MNSIKHRDIKFTFDDDTPFYWNPANPGYSKVANGTSFMVVAFEKYLIKVMRKAIPLINDSSVREEAQDLIKHEAHHSLAHTRHMQVICKQYPELNTLLADLEKEWDYLYQSRSLRANLAIVANIELMFTPIAKFMIGEREAFFSQGDAKVASMFIWHSMEELEHRSSALIVYNKLYGNTLYRLLQWPAIRRVMTSSNAIIKDHFSVVPRLSRADLVYQQKKDKSLKVEIERIFNFVRTQLPFYNPKDEVLPDFALQWYAHEEAGEDMTQYYGQKQKTSN